MLQRDSGFEVLLMLSTGLFVPSEVVQTSSERLLNAFVSFAKCLGRRHHSTQWEAPFHVELSTKEAYSWICSSSKISTTLLTGNSPLRTWKHCITWPWIWRGGIILQICMNTFSCLSVVVTVFATFTADCKNGSCSHEVPFQRNHQPMLEADHFLLHHCSQPWSVLCSHRV